jgi:hypothetical protein
MQLVCNDACVGGGSSDSISPVYSLWATFIGLYIANYVVERSTGWVSFWIQLASNSSYFSFGLVVQTSKRKWTECHSGWGDQVGIDTSSTRRRQDTAQYCPSAWLSWHGPMVLRVGTCHCANIWPCFILEFWGSKLYTHSLGLHWGLCLVQNFCWPVQNSIWSSRICHALSRSLWHEDHAGTVSDLCSAYGIVQCRMAPGL